MLTQRRIRRTPAGAVNKTLPPGCEGITAMMAVRLQKVTLPSRMVDCGASMLMKWSKLRSLLEGNFATSISQRVSVHSTRYGNCSCGRAWITIDGIEIANFCTRAKSNRSLRGNSPRSESLDKFSKTPVECGELSRQDAYDSRWDFVHRLSIDDALADKDPLIQTLAVLDKRIGKRKLKELDSNRLHPLANKLLKFRLDAEASS